ncbi:MAG: hypothetical protein IMZ57_04240, partial [Acidobacteria bacterium]|nr:hypothetical protein [Acidobacteriota bacterium]
MPDIYLGLTAGTAILLPPIRWMDGNFPTLPIDYTKQIDKASMLSGAQRFNFKSKHPRRWPFSWEAIRADELSDFILLNGLNQELQFVSGWDDIGWREVVITAFEYAPNVKTGSCPGIGAAVFYGDPYYGDPFYGGIGGGAGYPIYNVNITL